MAGTIDDRPVADSEAALVVRALDQAFGSFKLPQLAEVVDQAEAFLLKHCNARLRLLFLAATGFSAPTSGRLLIDPAGHYYELSVAPDAIDRETLVVAIVPRSPEVVAPSTDDDWPVIGYGQYSRVLVLVPKHLDATMSILGTSARAILGAGYGWLRDQLAKFAAQEEVALGERIYRFLKLTLPSEDVRANLWIATVTESYGFRVIQPDIAVAALDLTEPHASAYGESAFKLVAELLTTRLPREKLLMQKALVLDQPIVVDLHDALYRREGSLYASALGALYGSESFAIYPIRNEPTLSVLALYPAGTWQIDEALTKHKIDLQRICADSLQKFKRAERLFERDRRWRTQRKEWGDLVTVNPSFLGIGVDVKEVLKRMRSWFAGRGGGR